MQEGKAHDAASKAFALTPAMRARVAAAQTAEDMYAAIGQDCWVVVPIASAAQPGLVLEGSRLTLVSLWRTVFPCARPSEGRGACITLLGPDSAMSLRCSTKSSC